MKKVNLTGKLSLKKETIAKLNDEQMLLINGGVCTLRGTGCTANTNPCLQTIEATCNGPVSCNGANTCYC